MKEEDEEICNEALARVIREDPEMYKQIIKSIPGGAEYFREQWKKDFGMIVDVSAFTDEEIIDATLQLIS